MDKQRVGLKRMREIASAHNPLLKVFRRALAEGVTREGWLAVEGPFLVEEALNATERAEVHNVLVARSVLDKFRDKRREDEAFASSLTDEERQIIRDRRVNTAREGQIGP